MAESPIQLPKGPRLTKVRVTTPSYSGKAGDAIADGSTSYANKSIRSLRNLKASSAIRALARVNGMVSTAVQSYVSLAMSGYTVTAYDQTTHLFSKDGTKVAQGVLSSMDSLNDYTQGFNDKKPVNELLATMIKEVILVGSCGLELVLNKHRVPDRVVAFSTDNIRWEVDKDKTKYPVQEATGGGDDVPLNIPTIWIENLNQEADGVYSRSMLESCLNIVYLYIDFLEDMAKVVKKTGHSRVVASIVMDKAISTAPEAVKSDPVKLQAYLENIRTGVEGVLANANPDDGIVSFDNIEFDLLSDKSTKADYTSLLESLNGLVATSLKSMPSVLGLRLGKGSQSVSNTETLLYLKQVEAARAPVEAAMSRALTLACRLLGSDIFVKFEFNPVDLRPTNEIEAHKAIRQSIILDQLSLGFLSDDEAAHLLGAGFRAEGAPELSGTMFRDSHSIVDEGRVSPNNGGQEAALTPKNTSGGRGKNTPRGDN